MLPFSFKVKLPAQVEIKTEWEEVETPTIRFSTHYHNQTRVRFMESFKRLQE